MLSTDDLETLITTKKREIEKEKTFLGLGLPPSISHAEENKENDQPLHRKKQVNFRENQSEILDKRKLLQQNDSMLEKGSDERDLYELEEKIPPDLERYIRDIYRGKVVEGAPDILAQFHRNIGSSFHNLTTRYIGIPAMLKAGEYSPNNPILRAELNSERDAGDAFLGLGEYERRRNTLRKIRQAQYRQYLDQQAKKNQEAKEEVVRERREREEKERQREERERQLLLERESYTPERRRASVCTVPVSNAIIQTTKVDTGVQVDGLTSPLSVAVQTDDVEFYRLSPSPIKCLTQAERELSPRTVGDTKHNWHQPWNAGERRRSYGDFDERVSTIKKSNREKLVSDLRHSYMPSIFDADAIHMRNLQAEKEAAARRQFYQQELKNQILEQQRIREERKSREKMLEQAEMRRLEEQLRMLRVAQEREVDKHHDISAAMKDNAKDFDAKRTELQREIDVEQQKVLRTAQPTRHATTPHATTRHNTSKSDTPRSKLPFYYNTEKSFQTIENEKVKKPYSFNIPDNSVFSANYDVDTYLRKNLNFRDKIDLDIEKIGNTNSNPKDIDSKSKDIDRNIVIEKALIHVPKEKGYLIQKPQGKPEKSYDDIDNVSIPVLRHSPRSKQVLKENNTNLSEAMKKVDDKWKVPAVQKNILKSLPNNEGKNVNILTQLGSIRRQLQLEQLKLDKMLSKDES